MLRRLFAALENFPSHSQSLPTFRNIFALLWRASWESTAPLSLRVARGVVVQEIPMVLRKRKSISLTLAFAHGAVRCYWGNFDLSERPFVTIDKVMFELWSEQEGIEGHTEENLENWKRFRLAVMEKEQLDLANLNGHVPT